MSTTKSRLKALLISLSLLFFLLLGSATPISVHASPEGDSPRTVSIGINGGDYDGDMYSHREEQIKGFHEGIKKQDPAAECETVATKAELVENLKKLVGGNDKEKLKCGDQLVLFFNGHGTEETFHFVLDDETITLQEVLDLLKDIPCCVKIHVVFHACYSGSWRGLDKNNHVCSIYTSCNATEFSYNDWVWNGSNWELIPDFWSSPASWVSGFVVDLNNVAKGTKLDDALEEANKSAREKADNSTHPQEWWRVEVPEIPPNPPSPTQIAPIKLYPAADAEVRQFMPDTSLGGAPEMWVAPWGENPDSREHRTFVKFSLAPLPAGAQVQSATLNLYHSGFYGAGTGTYAVYRVSSDWEELITWDNQPQFAPSPTDEISFGVCDPGKWRSWDITADIDAIAIENGWVSWVIRYVPEDEHVQRTVVFTSKEGDAAPYLEITYLP